MTACENERLQFKRSEDTSAIGNEVSSIRENICDRRLQPYCEGKMHPILVIAA